MDRDVVFSVMALVLGGPIGACVGALLGPVAQSQRSGRGAEASSWRRLFLPVIPGVLAVVFLSGWALQEPDRSDEVVGPTLVAVAVLWSVALVRAVSRSVASMRRRPAPTAATSGILKPLVVIEATFKRSLDDDELRAVEAHEAAHARHRDPLRLWMAQFVTDLQWPAPRAAARWRQWRHWLEVARDEEAREAGADGAALAGAILAAARLESEPRAATAGLASDTALLRDRVGRLLRPLDGARSRPSRAWLAAFGAVLIAVAVAGVVCGDAVLHRMLAVNW